MSGKIDAEKVLFKKVFSEDFWFVIPVYQRSYVWQKDNISELIDDLYYAYKNKPDNEYFLGSLVLKKLMNKDYPEYDVLDGQQRLTTFFLMMAVFRDMLNEKKFKKNVAEKIYQEEDEIDKIPARVRIKYEIRDNVEQFIKEVVLIEDGTLNNENYEKFCGNNITIDNMVGAINVMKEAFSRIDDLKGFITFISNNALFIYVSTDNTEDAFRMFTILNDRGIPLTNADILKSENIGELSKGKTNNSKEEQKYAEIWEEIEGKHEDKFDRFLQFIRTIYLKDKARSNLLDEFENKIYKATPPLLEKGKATFDVISSYNSIYEKVIDLDEPKLSNGYKNLITIMKIGMRSDDWIPPLLYFFKKFDSLDNDNLYNFASKLEYKFTGDWVCGITPTLRLEAMNDILKAIHAANDPQEVINNGNLFEFDISDFKRSLSSDIYTKRYAKLLLLKIEYLSGDKNAFIANYGTISVEHVLPQNPVPNGQWYNDFSERQRKEWLHKLANLVLLSKKKNSALSNLEFDKKKEKYFNSRMDIFKANKVFLDSQATWTPDILEKRQEDLIKLIIKNN
ncbi:DUF262 domain-containing protein [Acetobacterium carbinolicum]|uniref:DUF262 domain-containing protein n=1 Tax=Acetobacterium carbinolicum TaxID=52690 RepID=UPI0039C9A848